MGWQSLGAVEPILGEWRDYDPSSQGVTNPTEGTIYRFEAINLLPGEFYKTYALVRFKYQGAEAETSYTRSFRVYPREGAIVQNVPIPPAISNFPFEWIPQCQKIVYPKFRGRSSESPWEIRIDDFLPEATGEGVEESIASINNLIRFLY